MCDFLSREASRAVYADGHEFVINKLEMVGNTGTYLDSPFHRYASGKDLSELELSQLAHLDAVVVRAPHEKSITVDADAFAGVNVTGKAVLVHTGWAGFWRTDRYFENHPYLTETAAKYLVQAGAKLVGIDSHNIDDTRTRSRPVHTVLLGAEIPICEHMCNLGSLPDDSFHFYAVPPKMKKFGTFPVRAFARVG
jgi:kynurenine formamidase